MLWFQWFWWAVGGIWSPLSPRTRQPQLSRADWEFQIIEKPIQQSTKVNIYTYCKPKDIAHDENSKTILFFLGIFNSPHHVNLVALHLFFTTDYQMSPKLLITSESYLSWYKVRETWWIPVIVVRPLGNRKKIFSSFILSYKDAQNTLWTITLRPTAIYVQK